ncbi:hypothetical protein CALCODRAFT_343313 [Calocera cornea HHB12733]|uniref:SGNH hydrolase-type esterase domain-containing protein n=1 Tax=Calocera cornea HHB12733 TaxID=1353952 RepID=A0A165EVS9_9BASI|nr:hypothetical protein CALCODRAFT_343313 [Calocera cornea HHB12733]
MHIGAHPYPPVLLPTTPLPSHRRFILPIAAPAPHTPRSTNNTQTTHRQHTDNTQTNTTQMPSLRLYHRRIFPSRRLRFGYLGRLVLILCALVLLLRLGNYGHSTTAPSSPSAPSPPTRSSWTSGRSPLWRRPSSPPRAPPKPAAKPYAYCKKHAAEDWWSRKFSKHNLDLSRAYIGSGWRFRDVVRRAARGEPVTMGVIGGSVSAGHGVKPNETFHYRILQQWNANFFNHRRNAMIDSSKPATGSDYFSLCFREMLPDNVDIVFVELSVNDFREVEAAIQYETLIRSLLSLPSKPAVVAISTFALLFSEGISTGGDIHLGVAEYYDVPVISLRNFAVPKLMDDYSTENHLFWNERDGLDLRHINSLGHELLADFTTAWMKDVICEEMDPEKNSTEEADFDLEERPWWQSTEGLGEVPRIRMTTQWDHETYDAVKSPICISTTSDPRLSPSRVDGWYYEEATSDKMYWTSGTSGKQISFKIYVDTGTVGIFFLRSMRQGLGNAGCWVDNKRDYGVTVSGYWRHPV